MCVGPRVQVCVLPHRQEWGRTLEAVPAGALRMGRPGLWLLALVTIDVVVGHTIGLLHRWNQSGVELSDEWKQVACASVLGVRHAAQRNGTVIAALGSIPSGHNFSSVSFDTGSAAQLGLAAWREALAAGSQFVVGAALSTVSTSLALNGAVDRMPQISYWSSAVALSDKAL